MFGWFCLVTQIKIILTNAGALNFTKQMNYFLKWIGLNNLKTSQLDPFKTNSRGEILKAGRRKKVHFL